MRILSYVLTLASSRMGTMALMGSLIFSPSASVPMAKSYRKRLMSTSRINQINVHHAQTLVRTPYSSHLFHAAQFVHCSLVVLHTVFSQLQVSGVLQKEGPNWLGQQEYFRKQTKINTQPKPQTHLTELLLVLRHLLQHLRQVPHCSLGKKRQQVAL